MAKRGGANKYDWGTPSMKKVKRGNTGEEEGSEINVDMGEFLQTILGGGIANQGGAAKNFAGFGHNYEETITRNRNHVYFWDQVTPENALKFSRLLREADEEQQVKLVRNEITEAVVYMHLNTPGGHLHEGFSMASVVEGCRSKTVAIVEGMVASAGTLPLVCADERHMQKYSSVLIHQLRGGLWGTFENNEDEIKNQRQAMTTLRKIYRTHTSMPSKELDRILKRELELSADKCVSWGIVHKLI